ncbi:hypothetical protein Q4E93_25040 [Flavitalea sp. BT771]|uniref:hypothetical protein n=1 Tax=Flavitalea sp. BT771 TaxID=3063329 RepID=UPI0026E13669|nr:hypothetical protein [Flavitalea sp. BT771]MDO6433897.1 hypothetical protein [Flavitalea sp. BT771]MDV6222198.1 hypothetical protein [Flavitalea sp. BT771]
MLRLRSKKGYLLLTIGIIVIGVLGWQIYKYRMVSRKVGEALLNKTEGLYSIHYEGLSFDEVGGVLHAKNIQVVPDTAVYRQLAMEGREPPMLLRLTIPALEITGVKTPKALLAKQVEGSKVEIAGATIEVLMSDRKKEGKRLHSSSDISREMLGKLLKIKMDSVKVTHADVRVSHVNGKEVLFSSNNVSFVFSDVLVDSTSGGDSSRILFARGLEMACDEIAFPTKNKKYRLHVSGVRFSSRNDALHFHQVKIIPQLPEDAFAHSFPVQKDRYNFSFEDVRLVHVSRQGLWDKEIMADSLVISKSAFRIYRDLSRPPDTTSKVGKYPQQLLMRLPIPIRIKAAVFTHSFIEYKERNGKSDSVGKLQFYDVSATLKNISNRKEDIALDDKCVLAFKARLLNMAPVDARVVMVLGDRRGRFSIDGNIGGIDAVALNPLTRPMGLARMENGRIHQLHFNFAGTDSSSDGKLLLLYDDLKISLLKKDEAEGRLDKKGLASLFANLILKNSNKGEHPRVEEVHFDRVLYKSFFNLIWKSIFTGVKQTVGMKK